MKLCWFIHITIETVACRVMHLLVRSLTHAYNTDGNVNRVTDDAWNQTMKSLTDVALELILILFSAFIHWIELMMRNGIVNVDWCSSRMKQSHTIQMPVNFLCTVLFASFSCCLELDLLLGIPYHPSAIIIIMIICIINREIYSSKADRNIRSHDYVHLSFSL